MDASSIHLPDQWQRSPSGVSPSTFTNAVGDQGRVVHIATRPDIGADLDDPESLWRFYRQTAVSQKVALVEAHKVHVASFASAGLILKMSQSPTGFTYLGSLTIPFADCSFVVVVQCQEDGTTGVREAMVEVVDSTLSVEGLPKQVVPWAADPFGLPPEGEVGRSASDDPQYDDFFPEHPLSRLRRYLNEICTGARFDSEVASLAPFHYSRSR